MAVINRSIKIDSSSNFQIIDITSYIITVLNDIKKEKKCDEGIVSIFTKHSTSAIRVNENEKGLLNDFKKVLKDLIKENDNYRHDVIDNNAASHIRALLSITSCL